MNDPALAATLDTLWKDGVLQREGERFRTTRRYRAARHRASASSVTASERVDRSNPIVKALLDFYGDRRSIDSFASFVPVLHAIESAEKQPRSE